EKLLRNRALVDDRVAPVVELDPLREQLGADAVPRARDRVHLEVPVQTAALFAKCSASPKRRVVGRRQERQGPWRSCSDSSSANTLIPLRRKRTAPSGRWQAPRRGRSPVQRSSRSQASAGARPAAISASRPARAGRPWLHGPHWPALSAASQPMVAASS